MVIHCGGWEEILDMLMMDISGRKILGYFPNWGPIKGIWD